MDTECLCWNYKWSLLPQCIVIYQYHCICSVWLSNLDRSSLELWRNTKHIIGEFGLLWKTCFTVTVVLMLNHPAVIGKNSCKLQTLGNFFVNQAIRNSVAVQVCTFHGALHRHCLLTSAMLVNHLNFHTCNPAWGYEINSVCSMQVFCIAYFANIHDQILQYSFFHCHLLPRKSVIYSKNFPQQS